MVRIMDGDDHDFATLAFGQPHPSTLTYFQDSINNAISATQHTGSQFFDKAKEAYNNFFGHEAMRRAKAAIYRAGSVFIQDEIIELRDLSMIQFAQEQMRNYIMSDPHIQNLYQKNLIEGYAERYSNLENGASGEDSQFYRAVHDGLVYEDEEGYTRFDTWFSEDLSRDLELDEQVDILQTQLRVQALIKLGKEDPTSIYGAMLD